jgi:plasmid stabilization system protein ParE
MEVCWSLAEDLERICERIERDNPEAARRIARTIYDGCARLKDFPRLGGAGVHTDERVVRPSDIV